MTEPGRPPVLPDIVEEHLDELDFLWELREGIVFAPDWTLEELAEHEARAEAHLDGLRLAELHAVDLARELLGEGEVFLSAAATMLLSESEDTRVQAELLAALQGEDEAVRDGVRIGLRHAARIGAFVEPLCELVREAEPAIAAGAADVLGFHRRALPDAARLLAADDAPARALAYGALGRAARLREPALVARALEDVDPRVRRAALEAAARCGLAELPGLCRGAATRSTDADPVALEVLGVLGDPAHEALLVDALARPELALAALRGLGALGRVGPVDALLERITDEALARPAAAAFQRITGVQDIRGERPELVLGGAAADAEDEAAEPPDDEAPPDPELARAWWEKHGSRFTAEERWQSGRALSSAAHGAGFDDLSLESRRDHFLGLRAARAADAPDLELEARADLQLNRS